MIFSPFGADFQWLYSNVTATRPATAWGTLVTAGATANTMGAYATLVSAANITTDVYGIQIIFNNGFTSGNVKNFLVDIGVDNAGGTSFITKIPFLMAGHSAPYAAFGGITYYFPLYIPSGSSIGIRAQGTVASSTFSTAVTLYGQPRRPDSVRVGSKVFSFGQTTATSSGTAITLGTAGEGAYTQVGTAATQSLWWWQHGYSSIDITMTAATINFDIAAGSSTTVNKLLIQNSPFVVNATEQIYNIPNYAGAYNNVAAGDLIYIRGQSSANADTTPNVMAWGLGG